MTRSILTLSAALLALPGSAWACGGFFCNNDAPVVQNAERIVFGVDADAGTVDTHVQISYSGPAEQFAWVVPVQTLPELFLSTDELFRVLDGHTRPRFNLQREYMGNCWSDDWESDADADGDADADSDADADTDAGGVTVIEEQRVGPYDTVILQATDDTVLIEWLQDNGYDIPATMGPALAPYIASGHYVIALRLSKGNDTGDLAPIGFTYPGTTPGIPIQLTSVAASPDMRLEAYVLGEHRYVPLNYLHVQINPLKVDWEQWWWQGENNTYNDVVTLAADEAGGHAFATDFSGVPPRGSLYNDGWYELEGVRTTDNAVDAIAAVQNAGFAGTSALMDILLDYIPPPTDVDAQSFYNCPACYDTVAVDGEALADALDERLVQPLIRAEAMMDQAVLSRMTSSISPAEMTVDPMFTANPDMEPVSNIHEATLTYDCRQTDDAYRAPRSFALSEDLEVLVPSEFWLDNNDMTLMDYLSTISDTNALIIEETTSSGAPRPIADHSDLLEQQIADANGSLPGIPGNGWPDEGGGCGCSSTRGAGFGFALLPLLLLGRRHGRPSS